MHNTMENAMNRVNELLDAGQVTLAWYGQGERTLRFQRRGLAVSILYQSGGVSVYGSPETLAKEFLAGRWPELF